MIFWKNTIKPQTPYYAVIFTSIKSANLEGYEEYDQTTIDLALNKYGCLGYHSQNKDGKSIFISYWPNKESINSWRNDPVHLQAKSNANRWYKYYHSKICLVEYEHEFGAPE